MDNDMTTTRLEIKSRYGTVIATTEEYKTLVEWARSANLSGANLSGADLNRAYLNRAYLSGADLSNARLSRADLSGADLSGADLSGANLSGANLSGADLSGANLSGAYLSGAYLSGAYLSNARLSRANLSGADLSGADLSNARLSGADLNRADLSNARLSGADLSEADLSEANLSNADLSGANLSGAKGLLDPVDWLKTNFESDAEGVIVYKRIGETEFDAPAHWTVEPGVYLTEVVNPTRSVECGCGVNFGTHDWCSQNYTRATFWCCRIEWWDLAGVVVPYNTDGKARCARLRLLKPV